ncbi:MAG TPA: holo-ACP synthase [Syntrophales bacterium]|nr:holo-ACP synthase [Syntrophales bacterium]
MIHGIGTDLVEVKRIERILSRWGNRFLDKVFAHHEIEYCVKRTSPAIHFAARFAAKESFLKSLGIGLGMGVPLTAIEIRNNELGNPMLAIHGKADDLIKGLGVTAVHVSIAHTRAHAHAVVILEKGSHGAGGKRQ